MTARILAGSVFDVLPTITPGSVDAVVTSPPYWMLRAYLPKEHPLKPQELGSEPTVQEFISNMVRVFSMVRDCMADHACCFLNIGDSYNANQGDGFNASQYGDSFRPGGAKRRKELAATGLTEKGDSGLAPGNLCLIPQRLAIALQDDGWIIRSVIVWHKPAPMPASVSGWMWKRCRVKVKRQTKEPRNIERSQKLQYNGQGYDWQAEAGANAQWSDCPGCEKCEPNGGLVLRRGSWRPTSSWEPILMLAKSQNYYADGEAVRTPLARTWDESNGGGFKTGWADEAQQSNRSERPYPVCNTAGANPRDVQTWASEPLKEKHYAAFPTSLVRFCLRAGTSLRGYCVSCGAPRARVVESREIAYRPNSASNRGSSPADRGENKTDGEGSTRGAMGCETTTLGWKPTCRCPEQEPRPGLVLDPFSGSARTGLTAIRMGLDYVGVELSPIYCELSRKLLNAENPLFNRVEAE